MQHRGQEGYPQGAGDHFQVGHHPQPVAQMVEGEGKERPLGGGGGRGDDGKGQDRQLQTLQQGGLQHQLDLCGEGCAMVSVG